MRSTLRLRLLVMILLVLMPAVAIITYDVYEARTRQVREAEQQGRQLAQTIISSFNRAISHVEGMLDLLTQIPQVRNLIAPECSNLMADIVRAQPRYATIIAVNQSGTILCASNPKILNIETADRPWFKNALATKSFTIGGYIVGRISHRPILGFAQPISGANGTVSGIAYASIDLAWFGGHDAAQAMPENASFTLVDQTGIVMARYPQEKEWITKSIADTPLFAALKKTRGTTDVTLLDLNGDQSFFHLAEMQHNPGSPPIYLALGLRLDENLATINRNIAIKIILLVAIALAVASFSYVASARMISRPVENMVHLSSRIAGGDLSVRSNVTHDGSEVGRLAQSLDSMAQSLERQKQDLIDQQEYMRAVLDNTSEMILCFNNDGRLMFINETGRAAGLPDSNVTFEDMIKANDAIFDRNMIAMPYNEIPLVRVMNGETVNNVEVLARIRKGDPIRSMLVNGQPILDEKGQRLGVVIAVRDITALRAAEASLRQAQKMEAVGQLTGGIAHDFNNLLGVIIGSIDTLLPYLKNPDHVELANEALTGALRGVALTRQMLAFARRQPLSPTKLDLTAHLPQLITLLRRTLGEDIEVAVHCAADLWHCFADPGQLDSVLLNFAINARDAMPNGGQLTIEASNAELDQQYATNNSEVAAGAYIRISVTDNGAGIAPEHLSRVMEPFFTTKEPGKGTGLGLSMAFGFAKQSGGHLKVYSEVGIGTTVNLYLPRALGSGPAVTANSTEQATPKGAERILLVDDNEAVRKTAARMLSDLGYNVIEAANGAEALRVLGKDRHIDLLFSDVVMPGGLSGFDLAAETAELYPTLKVLLVTGFAETALRNGVAKGNIIALMSKPYRRQELAERIRALLDNP